jgi:hypothetical protein
VIVSDPKQLSGARELGVQFPEREEKLVMPLTIRRPDEILAMQFDESDCILGDRLLAKGQPLTILGAGGIGKSRIALQLAVACIIGKRFLALETRAANLRWLFIQAENNNRRLQSDLAALKRWAGDKWGDVNERLVLHTLENDEDGFVNLDDVLNQGRITSIIAEHLPDVVVFDTLNCFAAGDLNKDADMRTSCQILARLAKQGNPDRAMIVLHHALTGKSGAIKATGYDRASFGRNSKVLQAWTRGQINVSPGSPDDNDTLVLSCGKCSNGKEFAPFAARLNPMSMIYEVDPHFDLAAWETEVSGKPAQGPSVTVELVAELCVGSMKKADLVRAIIDETGCKKSIAYKQIDQAVTRKRISKHTISNTYVKR